MSRMVRHVDELRLALPYDAIERQCRQYGVSQLAVFGSALRDDFSSTSDIDLLVEFAGNDAGPWMGKLQELERSLSALLGRTVQVCDLAAVRSSRNYIFRNSVLQTARTIYVA